MDIVNHKTLLCQAACPQAMCNGTLYTVKMTHNIHVWILLWTNLSSLTVALGQATCKSLYYNITVLIGNYILLTVLIATSVVLYRQHSQCSFHIIHVHVLSLTVLFDSGYWPYFSECLGQGRHHRSQESQEKEYGKVYQLFYYESLSQTFSLGWPWPVVVWLWIHLMISQWTASVMLD